MSETEQFEPMTEEEAKARIAAAFQTLDTIYLLHAPKDQTVEIWECSHCNVAWPCETEEIILQGLGVIDEPSESQEPSA